jgi:hypothetical protein
MQCLFQEWDMWQKVNKNHSRMEVQPKGWGFTSVAPDIVAAYSLECAWTNLKDL